MIVQYPEFSLFFLLLPPLILLLIFHYRRAVKELIKLCPVNQIKTYRIIFAIKNFFSSFFLILGLVMIGLQIMGLSWSFEPEKDLQGGMDVAVVVDVSPSMLCTDVTPSRLDAVRGAIYSMMVHLSDSWHALVAFRGVGLILQPLSQSLSAFRNLLGQLHPVLIDEPGSNLGAGVQAGLRALDIPSKRRKVLVVFSDFETTGADPAPILTKAIHEGIKVLLVGVGTKEGGKVPIPTGGFVKTAEGTEVVTRFQEGRFLALSQIPGVDSYRLSQGTIGLSQLFSSYKNPGVVMSLRPRSVGNVFLSLAVMFLGLSWLIRVIRWKNYF